MRALAALGLIVASVEPASAWTWTFSWAPDPTATSYKVEKTTDLTTWTEVTSPTARPTTPRFTYTGTEPALVCLRASNCNQNGCTTRPQDFNCHNESLTPPPGPLGISTQ